jgi:hypothetical protein
MSKADTPDKVGSTQTAESLLDRLIAEQGVTPIDDLDQLADLWPADDDPDALMNFVLLERQARVQPEDEQSK